MLFNDISVYLTALCLLGAVAWSLHRRTRHRLPPGPAGLPIIGNLLDAPRLRPWLVYQSWGKQFKSDIVYYRILWTRFFVLNKIDAAQQLLEQQSASYSDREESFIFNEMIGWGKNFGFRRYDDGWRRRRKLFHQHFNQKVVSMYQPKTQRHVRHLLPALVDSPQTWIDSVLHLSGSTILDIVYGVDVKPKDDPYMDVVAKALHSVAELGAPGRYLVDFIPVLRYLPTWLPGMEFKRQAAAWKRNVDEMFERPLRDVQAALAAGEARDCVASSLLADSDVESGVNGDAQAEDILISVAGTAYAAGAETTGLTIMVFVLAMEMYPEIQAQAQKELDLITGGQRLPVLEDMDSLPYITAILKEILRWRPVAPFGIPHKSTAAGEYNGYYIPAGSVVIANSWDILHDEDRYPDPDTFNPSRFLTSEGTLDADVPDPGDVFGYGRRICPGRHFAMDVIWLAIANILSVITIGKPLDENGNAIEPSGEFRNGLAGGPEPFEATFTSRSAFALKLIRESSDEPSLRTD